MVIGVVIGEGERVSSYNPLNDLKIRKLENRLMDEIDRVVDFLRNRSNLTPGEIRRDYPIMYEFSEKYRRSR